MKPKILVSRKISDLAEKKLSKEFDVTLNLKDEPISEIELIKIINDYDGMISTSFDKIGEDFFNNLNGKLKIKFDFIITVCDNANETCPIFPGESLIKIHKNFSDPTKIENGEYGNHFIKTRNEIKKFIQNFIENYLDK